MEMTYCEVLFCDNYVSKFNEMMGTILHHNQTRLKHYFGSLNNPCSILMVIPSNLSLIVRRLFSLGWWKW